MSSKEEVVHGIPITSRHGVDWELAEIREFIEEAHAKDLSHLIKEVFYDSNNSICVFTPTDRNKEILNQDRHPLMLIALKYISQFEWAGNMHHSPRSEQHEAEENDKAKE